MPRHHDNCIPGRWSSQQWEAEIPVEAVPTEYLENKSWTAQLTGDEKCLLQRRTGKRNRRKFQCTTQEV